MFIQTSLWFFLNIPRFLAVVAALWELQFGPTADPIKGLFVCLCLDEERMEQQTETHPSILFRISNRIPQRSGYSPKPAGISVSSHFLDPLMVRGCRCVTDRAWNQSQLCFHAGGGLIDNSTAKGGSYNISMANESVCWTKLLLRPRCATRLAVWPETESRIRTRTSFGFPEQ